MRINSSENNIFLLETYPSHELPYDGLSGIFNRVKEIGTVVPDTHHITGAKVLVCGIAPLYEKKISRNNSNILFTTFESDKLPENWVASINCYQHCIVPHETIKQVFQSSGIFVPISVVHQGYHRFERALQVKRAKTPFTVGFLGVPVNRKNLLKLYEACKQLRSSQIPSLALHVHVSCFYDWLDERPFHRLQEDEMVVWTTGKYSDAQIAAWYHRLSCYVFPSSGEGWSYTPRESMYLGVPTIVTDIPVHEELVESGFCKTIHAPGKEPAIFDGDCYGEWAKIEIDAVKEAILDVYNRYHHFCELAEKGAAWIENKWLNREIAQKIATLMAGL